jgi:DNA-binding XRE family transcriptional regulator
MVQPMKPKKDKQQDPPQTLAKLKELIDALNTYYLEQSTTKPTVQQYTSISELGSVIKRSRKQYKLNQKKLADLADLSLGTVVGIEKNYKRAKFENIEKILSVLGKTLWIKL